MAQQQHICRLSSAALEQHHFKERANVHIQAHLQCPQRAEYSIPFFLIRQPREIHPQKWQIRERCSRIQRQICVFRREMQTQRIVIQKHFLHDLSQSSRDDPLMEMYKECQITVLRPDYRWSQYKTLTGS